MSILSKLFEKEAVEAASGGLIHDFIADHQRCDSLWAAVEAADSKGLPAAFEAFDAAVRRHLAMEEEVLFPAFDAVSGMRGCGPTAVMCAEHRQMRALLDHMRVAADEGDRDEVLDQGDTLLMVTQQHNLKEEQMLYPMAQDHLASQWDELSRKLARY